MISFLGLALAAVVTVGSQAYKDLSAQLDQMALSSAYLELSLEKAQVKMQGAEITIEQLQEDLDRIGPSTLVDRYNLLNATADSLSSSIVAANTKVGELLDVSNTYKAGFETAGNLAKRFEALEDPTWTPVPSDYKLGLSTIPIELDFKAYVPDNATQVLMSLFCWENDTQYYGWIKLKVSTEGGCYYNMDFNFNGMMSMSHSFWLPDTGARKLSITAIAESTTINSIPATGGCILQILGYKSRI